METKEQKGKIYKGVLITIVAALVIEIIFGVFFTEQFGAVMSNMIYIVGDIFGWWINLLAVIIVVLGIVLVVFKYGDVVIGGKDAKPEFTTWQWFSISICGGIGCGLLFWAMGEPIFHYISPPVAAGITPESREAAIFAVSQAMFDWSFVQYFIYALPAVAFALLTFNYQKSLSFEPLVETTFQRRMRWLTTILHIMCGYAVASGVSNSMGAGLMQISGGINAVFGLQQGPTIYLLITLFVAAFFIISCLTGINKGLTYVSTACMFCFFGLMIYVVAFGDAQFIGKIGTEAMGDLMGNFWQKITFNNTLASQDQWANEWTITFWNSFFIYAPVIGMFLARMGKGRTVRQFILVEILVPSLFCCTFIAIFAGMIMKMQTSGMVDVWGQVQQLGMQTALYQVLGAMPGGKIVQFVFLITVCLSFITLADPNTSALATLCVHGQEIDSEPPKNIKIIIGVCVSAVAYLLVISGGMDAVKGLLNLGGLLMTIPTLWLCLMVFKLCKPLLKTKNYLITEVPEEERLMVREKRQNKNSDEPVVSLDNGTEVE
ncbi:BCCT family transporter [Eubacterium barkeri]|uniref:Choline-glycine betaine transporter n=1 Tax=Eubacterium barkeri TaxID=1528 RepID=A0A1H3AP34_EUBBA|nr:BCCT family transporter [Eubacterium barkeri]SDX31457.1 Choline-glycine betaine transporter [Eubacterium barkeri]